ncbi:MAG: FAD/NAD(P)-binding protein [Hyphomonadaceae bacterium]
MTENSETRRLAIIGGGFSGAAVALDALSAAGGKLHVSLIDRGGQFGRGLAYSTVDPNHLLNVPAQRMSVRADAPDDFVLWLQVAGEAGGDKGAFATRGAFGDYLEARMRRALSQAAPLDLIADEAIGLERFSTGFRVRLKSSAPIDADDVVLAYGHPPARAPFDAAELSTDQFKADPWDAAAIAAIPTGQSVLLLGAGLTMIDMAMTLTPREGALYALSRRGLTPHTHAIGGAPAASAHIDLPVELSDALHLLRREARRYEQAGETWQRLIDQLRPDVQQFWRRLTPGQQRRFLRHARPYWDVHRHRASPSVAARIATLRDAGGLRVIAGKIEAVAPLADGVRVTYRPRGAIAPETLEVCCIVNCTGADPDPRDHPSALIQRALADGLIRPNPLGLGVDSAEDGAVFGAGGAKADALYVIGPPTQGALWESTAVPEIRAAAARLGARIAAKVNPS